MLIIKQLKISKNDNFKRSAIYLVQRPCLLEISNTNYSVDSTRHKYTSINKFTVSQCKYMPIMTVNFFLFQIVFLYSGNSTTNLTGD